MSYRAPRGTQDVLGEEVKKWQEVEKLAREICERYHISELRTPIFEHTEVFARGNDASDMVNKEMYTFMDRGERSLTLKPEGTAGLVRAFVEHKLYANPSSVQRFFYFSPNFRYERPQKGRMRIFHQFGVEFFGEANPYLDLESIMVGLNLLDEIGVHKYKLVINTLGDAESQAAYKVALKEHFKPHLDTLCSDCQRRYEQNPLRMLDCKVDHDHEAMKTAPINLDYLNEESQTYFETLKKTLDEQNIPYEVDPRMVRGLDYYTHTVYEVISTDENAAAQSTIFAGGRYSHMVEYFGGPQTDAVGFAVGIERLLIYAELAGVKFDTGEHVDVFAMPMGQESNMQLFKLITELRKAGFCADMDYENKSMKAQFKMVDRTNAKIAMISGGNELEQGVVNLKNIETQEQVTVSYEDVVGQVRKWLGK
ncbi:histidine--tRNA ligase [Erysipelothrix inopinata]|uniref:Histidine--tRNA ligase n=2 Tax=Erysipelothrix inopinata TaxID=225084 RepID=A0A7G9RX68_9FIRM|nr:histidine--tRNA ligase [Erysipelothrix inopinata]QNN60193.1 histidine--tRNA ligase [Erysipelothrix inopinata]